MKSKQTLKPLKSTLLLTLLFSASLFMGCSDDTEDTIDTEDTEDTEDTSTVVDNSDYTVGLIYKTDDVEDGYTLFSPMMSTTTYLVNNCGELVQSWPSDYSAQAVYLLENGNLLHTGTVSAVNSSFEVGGQTGRVEIISPEGEVTWYYEVNSTSEFMHHDVEYIETTGTILMMVWEKHTATEAKTAGRTDATAVWSEKIIEVDPTTDEIIWQWDAWDHLVQDENSDSDNYGSVSDNPQLLNFNFTYEGADSDLDWLHCNAVDYNEDLDQIVVSSRNFSEFWIIDHSTTTEESASHEGGKQDKGGDILYRWGNPQTYDMGNDDDQMTVLQHDVNWIPNDYTDGGQIMVFNNQAGSLEGLDYSAVNVVDTNVGSDGSYSPTDDGVYLPTDFTWTYEADTKTDFYGAFISGARRLSNGNTMIGVGPSGTFFEVTYDGETVWEYINPVDETGIVDQYTSPSSNYVFRCTKYSSDYAGLEGYDLTSQGTLESGSDYTCE